MDNGRSQATADNRPAEVGEPDTSARVDQGKGKRRGLFGLGRPRTGESSKMSPPTTSAAGVPPLPKETSQVSSTGRSAASPTRHEVFVPPASPSRALSASPRLSSPAGSQIFERDVQDHPVVQPNSPAIPTHIQTENHIPPVLGDASEAITNQSLDPDAVEIVTQRSHQPAAVAVSASSTCMSGSQYDDQSTAEWAEELSSFSNRDPVGVAPDNASNYGSLDSADVRRLSFISFADVVQSEQGGAPISSRESIHMAGLTSLPPSGMNRSPSPIRSPVSSQGPGTSPPTSNPGSMKGVEMSPSRKPMGSPRSGSQSFAHMTQSGELSIETMSQALRRTGSRDMGVARSIPTSPIEGPGSR